MFGISMSDENTMTLEGAFKEIEDLKEQKSALEKERDEYLNGWKRAKADYVNFKNEQEKRSAELATFARMASLMQYLPVVENFRKAFQHVPDELKASEWIKGIEHIYRQMKDILRSTGVEEIADAAGTPFDPSVHEAVGHEWREDMDEGVITQEISAGYRHNGTLIVPAKVIVNKKPQPAGEGDSNEKK